MSKNFISLFSGAGGLDLGFILEGWNPVLMVDNWKPAIDTLEKNHPTKKSVLWDLAKIDRNMFLYELKIQKLSFEDIDCIIGGPPCQPFSRLNQNQIFDQDGEYRPENLNDPRRSLFMSFIEIVNLIRSPYVVMENVFDLANRKLGGDDLEKDRLIVDIISEEFAKIGYIAYWKVLETDKYGVPQKRKRLVFIAVRSDIKRYNMIMPKPIQLLTSVKSEFEKIKPFHPNQGRKKHSKEWLERVKFIPQGGYYNNLPIEYKVLKEVDLNFIQNYKGQSKHYAIKKDGILEEFRILKKGIKTLSKLLSLSKLEGFIKDYKVFRIMPRMGTYLRRINWDISHTVTRNPLIHPEEDREITIREKASIQTFPPDFEFVGKIQEQHILIGNAVPVNLGKEIAKQIERIAGWR